MPRFKRSSIQEQGSKEKCRVPRGLVGRRRVSFFYVAWDAGRWRDPFPGAGGFAGSDGVNRDSCFLAAPCKALNCQGLLLKIHQSFLLHPRVFVVI